MTEVRLKLRLAGGGRLKLADGGLFLLQETFTVATAKERFRLKGASKELYALEGSPKVLYPLKGPSKEEY